MIQRGAREPGKFTGLTEREVLASRREHGDNNLTRHRRRGFFRELLGSFGDPIIKLLLIALAVNVVIKLRDFDWYDSLGIAAAILISTFVSTLSEYGSASAFERLQEEALRTKCRVRRRAGLIELPVGEVVVGDYVLLQPGERVPADGQLVSGAVSVDQSPLNGESREAYKSPDGARGGGLDDAARVFRGCVVETGEAVLRVERVGMGTFYGKLAHEVQEEPRESPLAARMRTLAGQISKLGYLGAGLVALANLFSNIVVANGFDTRFILAALRSPAELSANLIAAATLAISVIVVAIPEGLPLMITVVLSSNMKRMLRDHVLVRRLVGIETSGSLNILFTDKTGTLTKGKLAVSCFLSGDGTRYDDARLKKTKLFDLLQYNALCNTDAAWGTSGGRDAPVGGNATERAILAFTRNKKPPARVKVTARRPFDSAAKFSWARLAGEVNLTLCKGAPELILPACGFYYDENGAKKPLSPARLRAQLAALTGEAHRLLALAAGETPPGADGALPGGLTLIGVLAIRDAVRPSAVTAIRQVTGAGVQVVMITGDNRETAAAIARETGLLRGEKNAVLTSGELNRLSDAELKARLPALRVVARAVPSDKSRLVRLAQEAGLVTGMTGDGINDAPALRRADVGFAMGSGTEVAKEAGDIVILDDDFRSVAKAILYGRTIFKSIRKFIIFQLTINLCAVGVSALGPFFGVSSPITVLQMLWVNMVMDTLAGLAFAGEAPLPEYMAEPPKTRGEPIISPYMYNQIFVIGAYVTVLCLVFLCLPQLRARFAPEHFMTAFFAMFIFAGVMGSFNARTPRLNLLAHIWKNKAFLAIMALVTLTQLLIIYRGGSIFRTAGLTARELQAVLLLAFTVIPVDLIRKALISRRRRGGAV